MNIVNLKEENIDALFFKVLYLRTHFFFWWTYIERILLVEILIMCDYTS